MIVVGQSDLSSISANERRWFVPIFGCSWMPHVTLTSTPSYLEERMLGEQGLSVAPVKWVDDPARKELEYYAKLAIVDRNENELSSVAFLVSNLFSLFIFDDLMFTSMGGSLCVLVSSDMSFRQVFPGHLGEEFLQGLGIVDGFNEI